MHTCISNRTCEPVLLFCAKVHAPVGYIDTDDAGLQYFSMLVGAGGQQPALVVGQTVANKQDVVLLGCFAKRLPELCLLVFHWSQNEGRRVQTETLRPLRRHNVTTTSDSVLVGCLNLTSQQFHI